jgi:hypothetical protein
MDVWEKGAYVIYASLPLVQCFHFSKKKSTLIFLMHYVNSWSNNIMDRLEYTHQLRWDTHRIIHEDLCSLQHSC